MRKGLWLVAAMALFLFPTAVLADSISPSSFTADLAVGGSTTISKTVTINSGLPTTGAVDVFFLCDTTGSMGGIISTMQSNAGAIMSSVSASLGSNVAFGSGSYRDFYVPGTSWGSSGDYSFRVDSTINTNTANATAGIGAWVSGGGNDGPEADLEALYQSAGAAPGWRAGSKKIVVWFGDAPGHDPSSTSGSAYTPGYPGHSQVDAIAALNGAGVTVEAVNAGGTYFDSYGQVTAVTTATGGIISSGSGAPADVAAAIVAAIESAFAHYSTVSLDVSGAPAGVSVGFTPGSYTGAYDRSIDRTFAFDVTFTGVAPGTYGFDIYATVDGARVAAESDRITVGGTAVPEPGTLLLLGSGLVGLVGYRRRARMM